MSKPDYRAQAIRIMTSPYGLETVESLLLAHDLHLTVMPRLRDVAEAARSYIRNEGEGTGEVSAASLGRSLTRWTENRTALVAALDALDGGRE